MYKKKGFVVAGVFALLSVLLIVLVKNYDVSNIGPMDTSIGFSHINSAVHDFFGIHIIWYKITEVFGILALLVCGCFAVVGLIQLLQRKSIAKVDAEVLKLGGLYVIVLGLYAMFEKVIINYRPVIMPDATEPEASFPSSHTMLICVVMACALIMIVTVVGRLICGVHWFTDIIGGILISLALLSAFKAILES